MFSFSKPLKAKKIRFELRGKNAKIEIAKEKRFGFLHYDLQFFLSSAGGHNAEPLVTLLVTSVKHFTLNPASAQKREAFHLIRF